MRATFLAIAVLMCACGIPDQAVGPVADRGADAQGITDVGKPPDVQEKLDAKADQYVSPGADVAGGLEVINVDAELAPDAGSDAEPAPDVSVAVLPPPAQLGKCEDWPLGPLPPIPPMKYAEIPAPLGGTLSCGPNPGPYFWTGQGVAEPTACTGTCAATPHAEATICAGGQCVVTRCGPGWQDRDAIGSNGCEVEVPVACDLYVAATASGATVQDGTAAHPLASLRAAVCAADPGCVIHIGAGDYLGGFTIDKPGVVLRGAGPSLTRIAWRKGWQLPLGMGPPRAVLIAADDVVLEGLALYGGCAVVIVDGLRTLSRNVAVGPNDGTNSCAGSWSGGLDGSVSNVQNTRVTAAWIHDMSGDHGSMSWGLPSVFGLGGGPSARVVGTRVEAVHGIDGCIPTPYGDCIAYPGGGAVGISAGLVTGCQILGVSGGAPSQQWSNNGAYIPTYGSIHAIEATWADSTNRVEGKPWLHLRGCKSGKIQGFDIQNTSFGVAVDDSEDVTVTGNVLAPWNGPALAVTGCKNCNVAGNSCKGVMAPGLRAKGSPGIVLSGNTVSAVAQVGALTGLAVIASPGCTVHANVVAGVNAGTDDQSPGFPGTGVLVQGSEGCSITDNTVSAVKGGSAYTYFSGSVGGIGTGLLVKGSPQSILSRNRVFDVNGGGSAFYGKTGSFAGGYQGPAMGVHIEGSEGTLVTGLAVSGLKGGVGFTPDSSGVPFLVGPLSGSTRCVDLADTATITLDHLSCDGATDAIYATHPVVATHSIFANTSLCKAANVLSLSWTDLWLIATCPVSVKTGPGMLAVDPQFVDAKGNDLHLKSTSPCLDVGDPAAPFCAEPAPNGCRVDLGAFGGTKASTPMPGAKHCACPN